MKWLRTMSPAWSGSMMLMESPQEPPKTRKMTKGASSHDLEVDVVALPASKNVAVDVKTSQAASSSQAMLSDRKVLVRSFFSKAKVGS